MAKILDGGIGRLPCGAGMRASGKWGWRVLRLATPGTVPCRALFLAFLITFSRRVQRGLVEMAEKEDERPSPGRLAAPGAVSCRAPFLAFLIHKRSASRCAGGGPSCCSWPGASRATLRSRR